MIRVKNFVLRRVVRKTRLVIALSVIVVAVALPVRASAGVTLAHALTARSEAAVASASPDRKAFKPKKARQAKKTKPALQPDRTPSGETVADRERRLMRECKGRPNAGACLGFAS